MIRTLTCIVLATAWLARSAPAEAAQSYDNCSGFVSSLPATISTQGTWCLDNDLSTAMASGNAITIATNNVTLDCNHFKIGGLAAGVGTATYGIRVLGKLNTTVRNCNIRGFYVGVYFPTGGGHLVEDNSFDGNTAYGIYVASPGSTIRNNLVIDTGGSTVATTGAWGIYGRDGVDILDNTITGVAPSGTNAHAIGIHTFENGSSSVNGNRVRGLAPVGSGKPFGIATHSLDGGMIRNNDVQGFGTDVVGGIGIKCSSNAATARGNMVAGYETGILDCYGTSNDVNPN